MGVPANVAEALKILRGAEADLTGAVKLGYTTAIVVPGNVPSPEEATVTGVRTTGLPQPIAIRAVVLPEDKYMAWRAAWEVLIAYAGWWGRQERWPLGDGTRARSDPATAINMPPLGAALAALSATLTAIQAPTWKPEIRLSAILSAVIFVVGARQTYLALR